MALSSNYFGTCAKFELPINRFDYNDRLWLVLGIQMPISEFNKGSYFNLRSPKHGRRETTIVVILINYVIALLPFHCYNFKYKLVKGMKITPKPRQNKPSKYKAKIVSLKARMFI